MRTYGAWTSKVRIFRILNRWLFYFLILNFKLSYLLKCLPIRLTLYAFR